MEYLVIPAAAALTSALTLFSGFGLGTLLMPVFALFFPLPLAVALTAIVHVLNNVFKSALLGRYADRHIVWRFGLPALVGAVAGAWALISLTDLPPLATYAWLGAPRVVSLVKLVVAVLMVGFALVEVLPQFKDLTFDSRYLPFGVVLSGFFGGLSGHQGALRSAFLIRSGLSKEQYIGTGIIIAILVDITRLTVYGGHFAAVGLRENRLLLVLATLAAFLGAWIGARLMQRVTMRSIQFLVIVLLFAVAFGLGSGLI